MNRLAILSFTIAIMLSAVFLSGCTNFGDTVVKRGGDNTGFKDWAVEQTFKWGK